MDRCVRLSFRYQVVDDVVLTASAWNGRFGGSTCLCIARADLADIPTRLAGFPVDPEDKREVTIGGGMNVSASFDELGAMTMRFACVDGAGHCQLHMTIDDDFERIASFSERVEMQSEIEPAAVDEFVEQMRAMNSSLTGSAVLRLL